MGKAIKGCELESKKCCMQRKRCMLPCHGQHFKIGGICKSEILLKLDFGSLNCGCKLKGVVGCGNWLVALQFLSDRWG